MRSAKGSRDYDDDEDFENDDNEDEWIEIRPRLKKVRSAKTRKPVAFAGQDTQQLSTFLARVPTVLRIQLLTRHLGFRDCLYFARSCKKTYADMMFNPLFLRYYVRGLLHRYDGGQMAPLAGLSDLAMLHRLDKTVDITQCAKHMQHAKRAVHESPTSPLPPDSVLSMGDSWPDFLSSTLLRWERGDGGCLSSFSARAKQILFFLLHTFDLDGSVFQSYFSDLRYQGHYRTTAFSYRNLGVADFWVILECVMANRAQPFMQPVTPGHLSLPGIVGPFALFQDALGHKFRPSACNASYRIHERLARDLQADQTQPVFVRLFWCLWDKVKRETVTMPVERDMGNGIIKRTLVRVLRNDREAVVSIVLELDPVGLPALVGVQDCRTPQGLFYPRRALWFEWCNEIMEVIAKVLKQ